MGNVELFELCDTIPKEQCKECLLCWSHGIVYCTCGHLLKVKPAEVSSYGHWIFSQSRTMSLRNGDFMAIVAGRLKNKRNTTSPIFEKEMQKERIWRDSRSLPKDPEFRESQLCIDRTEEVCIQMEKDSQKDFTFEWRKMSTFDAKRIGGSLSINLEISDRWEIVLTSTKRWLNYTVFTKRLEKSNSRRFLSGNIRWQWNDSWWSSWQLTRKSATEIL